MGYNKKVGIVLMVASILAAIISFLISDCDFCNFSEASLLALVMYGFRLRFSLDDLFAIDIATKYALLLCLAVFALGLLYYIEVFNAPRRRVVAPAPSRYDE